MVLRQKKSRNKEFCRFLRLFSKKKSDFVVRKARLSRTDYINEKKKEGIQKSFFLPR